MCLIAFDWNNHPLYKLIFISNRDEFYSRKTQKADYWPEHPEILAGKDLEGGGTWLGLTKTGRISALTNYRDPFHIRKNTPTRGELTTHFLSGDENPQEYMHKISPKAGDYNGFNLLSIDLKKDQLFYFSNYQNKVSQLGSGLYGLSNHLLDTDWYKVRSIKKDFQKVIENPDFQQEELLEILHNPQKAEGEEVQQTGLPLDKEQMLSAIFIQSEDYGTCASSILLADYEGNITFTEKLYNTPDKKPVQKTFQFKIE